jgi:hypothetical protein
MEPFMASVVDDTQNRLMSLKLGLSIEQPTDSQDIPRRSILPLYYVAKYPAPGSIEATVVWFLVKETKTIENQLTADPNSTLLDFDSRRCSTMIRQLLISSPDGLRQCLCRGSNMVMERVM